MSGVKSPNGESRYLNRELSWLNFNRRVLEEAVNPHNPLLERLRFLSIFESNLDEFYMVRVSGLIEQFESGVLEETPDGLTPSEQLKTIAETALPLRKRAGAVFSETLRPEMEKAGIFIRPYKDLGDKRRRELSSFFAKEVFPLCTPLILHPATKVPIISSRSLNLAIELADNLTEIRLARIKVPTVIPRAVKLSGRGNEFVLLEEIIAANLHTIFPGVEILRCHLFRVIRDADVEIRELEAADLIASIEETLRLRRMGDPVLLECQTDMPKHIRNLLVQMHGLDEQDVFAVDGLLGFGVFDEIYKLDKPRLRFAPFVPYLPENMAQSRTLFETISSSDILVHHPYDSFRCVEEFVASATKDPDTIGIKQTLYRVGSESPVVESLLAAAGQGKQVAAMVELKARFDESNNLGWARALEHEGVHVTYGFPEFKTHCKLCLVVRREAGHIKMYAHVGTGNYNPVTARQYTDLGLFTCDESICQDISEMFNYLTGFSRQTSYRKLLVAPLNLREGLLKRIKKETRQKKDGRIIFKLNALVDPEVVEALYAASKEGVKVELLCRGVCCLKPGVPGMSENIRVFSIVGRLLEHSRIYYFGNGGNPDVLIGSADCMRRNLDRRIEVLAPVEDLTLKSLIKSKILDIYLRDTLRTWELAADGTYSRRSSEKAFDAQAYLISHPFTRDLFASRSA
ncbi:MAG TPA: polyphosphate kinase 1 [Fimbriimonas sp.]|nr:polyphosphate kinase 1 [Fimbriimonas sp.]